MTRPRLTKPGITDLHWMCVVCTPLRTSVTFHEDEDDATAAAWPDLRDLPRSSVYVGRVTLHGENTR